MSKRTQRSRFLPALLLAAAGCTPTLTVETLPQRYTGVAVSATEILTVLHPPHIGQRVSIRVQGVWYPAAVTRVGPNGLVLLDTAAPLTPGDSGSPVRNNTYREIIAAIIGRK